MSLTEYLKSTCFFQKMRETAIEALSENAELTSFAPGEVVFRQGDPADDLFIVINGNIILEILGRGQRGKRVLSLFDGDMIGWSTVLGRAKFTATAKATSETTAIRLRGVDVAQQCEADPEFGYQFMRQIAEALADRLSSARMQFLDVYNE